MNSRVWIGITLLLLSLGAFYSWTSQTKLREAETRADIAQERSTQLSTDQVRQSWEKVEDAALTLMEAEPNKRREALRRFRHELQKLKSQIGYKQLGTKPKEDSP
jgi:hypothetical protein